jgi:hypothetical protein
MKTHFSKGFSKGIAFSITGRHATTSRNAVCLMALLILGVLLAGVPVHAQNCDISGTVLLTPEDPLTGVVNSYFPGQSVLPVAGGSQITIKSTVPGQGASGGIAVGDLVIVMQMQDATINILDALGYGGGGLLGNGQLALNSCGLYEFARVTGSTVTSLTSGGTITVRTTNTGTGLANIYTDADATLLTGQKRFQVIRVPQYVSVGIGNGLTCSPWDGRTGGVLAIDVQNVCQFTVNGNNGVINVDGLGFRGGVGRTLGINLLSSVAFLNLAFPSVGNDGIKGEGIAGTPPFLANSPANEEGIPGGCRSRGGPGNAGGGGNGDRAGGGGGSCAGGGGNGGNDQTNSSNGGIGGAIQTLSASRVFLGGGGGAGSSATNPTDPGANGGGIVFLRAGIILGTGTISANGGTPPGTSGDGGSGGGAGGAILVAARNPAACVLNLNANGSNGGGGGNQCGNGGGGGGGAVLFSAATLGTVTPSVTGGAAGVGNVNARAGTNGSVGVSLNSFSLNDFPGTAAVGLCITPTEVKLQNFEAVSYSNGEVGLSWNTGFEADNLGFRVWRESNGKRELITGNGLVAGSALLAGTTLTAGNRYAWRDGAIKRGKAGTTVSYWLEDIDLNGKSSWNGPFELKSSKEPMPESLRNAPLLGRNNPVFGSQTTKSLNSADPMELNRYLAESATVQTAAKSEKSSAFQQTLAAGPAVKLGVRTTGWQSVSRSALVGAGLNPNAVDANLKMYVNGSEVPIRVSANSVEFYGVAADTLQSGEQTYWLVEGNSAGLRIPTAPFGAGSRLGAVSFASLVERRDRTTYFAALQNGDADNFFGAVVSNTAVDQAVTLKNRDAGASFPAQVAVTLQGVSLNSHRVSVKLNGQTIGEVTYANRDQQTFTTTVAQSQLLEGQNTVTLQSADSSDVNLVAAVRISYARSFVADADALSLSGRAGQTLTVRGFSQTPRVFDVTDPANPVEVAVRADGAGTGNVSASFVAPGAAGSSRQLVATTASRFLTPTVTSNTPSTLSASSNAADFVILTTPELAPALTPLVQLRQSQGLTVKVVDVADVYDEFSFGVKSAQAIKDFLNFASHNWQTPVRYAMFAGDASFDPRDFLGFNQDVVPTKLLGLGSLETASDDWFGDFNDSGLSEIAIGRLPGRTQAEINAMVSKIVAYDQARGQAWQRDAIIVADNNDDGGNFESAADSVEAALPGSFAKTSIKVGQIGGAAARTQLLSALNEGKGFVNYLGHGSVSNWAAENLLTSNDVANLTNTTRPSLVVGMTCLNGFFDLYTRPLGKELVLANGKGAAAVLASSSLTLNPEQASINRALVQTLFSGANPVRLGDAIRQAKTVTRDINVTRSLNLFGDPTARVR